MRCCSRIFVLAFILSLPGSTHIWAQSEDSVLPIDLSVESIMRDPAWMGHEPSELSWSWDSKNLYFKWNPEPIPGDTIFQYDLAKELLSATADVQQKPLANDIIYAPDRKQGAFVSDGDIYLLQVKAGAITRLTQTTDAESSVSFDLLGEKLYFKRGGNYYSIHLPTGQFAQLSDFRPGHPIGIQEEVNTAQKAWLARQEAQLIKSTVEAPRSANQTNHSLHPKPFFYGSKELEDSRISPDGRFITFRLKENPPGNHLTSVPQYLDPSGYTRQLYARPKVGSPQPTYEFAIYDRQTDSVSLLDLQQVPGLAAPISQSNQVVMINRSGEIDDDGLPELLIERDAIVMGPIWSEDGKKSLLEIRSLDFKDRWIMNLEAASGSLTLLDHQHDDAWIDGPGIGRWLGNQGEMGWIPGSDRAWLLSEESGFAHLYSVSPSTGNKQALTWGKYEVSQVQTSRDGDYFYFSSNEAHPGEQHFYRMSTLGGERLQLTHLPGQHQVTLSPDEKFLAIRYSNPVTPWEFYLQKNKEGAEAVRITHSQSQAFQSYPWRMPEIVRIQARDGAHMQARLYRPQNWESKGAAVLFVHGAGYLQNAHKGWSDYFREYMFHNLLADRGIMVLDIDYRGSAGYGRDWRADVYRHMGGKDLSDHVDAAQWLVNSLDVDPKRIGIYGGSYGGFITLMALFTEPGVFACGAALRPVTDWAHYNHAYTAPMLNQPQDDSLAYVQSSPIYHAEGLEDPLLICHGMVDTNVHFQDVVRLSQRLIELGKEDWEVAFYPMEGHGFTHPDSWTDEYKRILKLFEEELLGN